MQLSYEIVDPRAPELAAFVFRHNRLTPQRVRCLHSDAGLTLEEHERELLGLPSEESLFVTARAAGVLVGVSGAEYDLGLARAWVRAPLLEASIAPAVRHELMQRLMQALPSVERFDAFVYVDDDELNAYFGGLGWERASMYHGMATPEALAPPAPAANQVFDALPIDHHSATRLHAQLFPASYLPPDKMVASLDGDHRLFVTRDDAGHVTGYLYARHRRAEHDGYVDYLGVAEPARRRGLGRALLATAMHWLLGERAVTRVELTVQGTRAPALGLYRQLGFEQRVAGVHWIGRRSAAAAPGAR
jgi:ribosomal protein S18 acetylase RimI-like enzyme